MTQACNQSAAALAWEAGRHARRPQDGVPSNGEYPTMKTAFALGALATLMVAGAAVAHLTVDLTAADQGIYYLPEPGTADEGVWEESNGLDGLQETETVLEDGTVIPPDTRVAA